MPYKEHPEFDPPDSENAFIWRYMDLAKFLSILDRKALFFPSVAALTEFDTFEGLYTNANLMIEEIEYDDLTEEIINSYGLHNETAFNNYIDAHIQLRNSVKKDRGFTFVNSWHIKEYESAAMWNQYLSNHEGVAIQSTYNRLKNCFNDYNEADIYIGKIKYIDYQKDSIPMKNSLSPFLYKRKSFEYEDELRALIWRTDLRDQENYLKNDKKILTRSGIYIPIDLNIMIDNIYVSPEAPHWIVKLIKSLTRKLGYHYNVIQSKLGSPPLY